MFALGLKEAERWFGIEHVYRTMDVRTVLVLAFAAVAGVQNNRAHQR